MRTSDDLRRPEDVHVERRAVFPCPFEEYITWILAIFRCDQLLQDIEISKFLSLNFGDWDSS